MSSLEKLLSSDLIRSLGWSLVHSLWQGAILALLFAVILLFLHKYSSKTRYFLSVSVLLMFFLSFAITFTLVYSKYKNAPATSTIVQIDNPVFTNISEQRASEFTQNDNIIAEQTLVVETERLSIKKIMAGFTSYYNEHLHLIVTIWLLGVLLLTLKLLGGLGYAQRLKKYKIHQVPETWQDRFMELKSRFGLNKKITFLESALAKVPQAIGYFKPAILLPAGLLTGLSAKQIESIILHELAHIFRRDYLINIIQSIVEIIFFYHPAVWWISSIIREERENCCDDMVVEMSGDKINYMKTLVDLEEYQNIPVNMAMAISGKKGNKLFNRIKRISLNSKRMSNFSEGFVAACIIFFSIFILGFSAHASVKKTGGYTARNINNEELMSSDSVLAIQFSNGKYGDSSVYIHQPDDSILNIKASKDKKNELVISQADSIILLAKNFANVDVKQENGMTSIVITNKTKVQDAEPDVQPSISTGRSETEAPTTGSIRETEYVYGNGKLFEAVKNKNYMETERLLKAGANPNERNKDGYPCLVEASKRGMYSITKLLLEYGADPDITYNDNWTPLLKAVQDNRYATVDLLITNGADVNHADVKGWTPLMEAGDEDYIIMKTLIDHGANIHFKSHDGRTALFEAVKGNSYENTKQLLDAGAKVNVQQYDGYTCLMEAADEQLEITILLLQRGADINLSKYNGWTPLHNAIKDGRYDLTKLLIDNGADLNAAYKGLTPYEYARDIGQHDLARLLKKEMLGKKGH
ncbi:MAG: ankyrin repeat domain-containing protein [Bacteroidales bacterium]|nr:ankyrin repeat domain-containing protein [Bacteroidales bacterium]